MSKTMPVTVNEYVPETRNLYERTSATTADMLSGTRVDGDVLGYSSVGSYAGFKDVNFGEEGAKRFALSASSPHETDGLGFEVRLDSPGGQLIGTVDGKSTGAWGNFETFVGNIDGEVTGIHDVYFVFQHQMNLKWVQFSQDETSQTIMSMEVRGDKEIFLPETGTAEYTFTAVGRDDIDAEVLDVPAIWSLDKEYEGISIDEESGIVSVTDKAPQKTQIQVIAAAKANPEMKAQMNVLDL